MGDLLTPFKHGSSHKSDDTDPVPIATTTVRGTVELATDAENAANVVVQGNDSRLSDSRAPNGSASGDLTGSYPNPTVTTDAITFAKMANVATDRLIGRDTASTGDPEALTVGGGIEFTGSGGIQTSAFTGDVTKSAGGTATTIANDAVTYAKMQNVSATSRVLGRITAGAGDTEELTGTQMTSLIDAATTSASGKVELATDGEKAANVVVQGNDTRLRAKFASASYEGELLSVGADAVPTYLLIGSGILFGLSGGIGGVLNQSSGALDTTNGPYALFTTGAVSGNDLGEFLAVNNIQRKFNVKLFARFKLEQTTTTRLMLGFSTGATTSPTIGDDWLNAKSGFMLYVTSGGAFRVGYNDGSGATVFTSSLAAADTNVHTIYLEADDTNSRWGYSFDGAAITYLTTDIPAQTTSLAYVHFIETAAAAAKSFRLYRVKMELLVP